MKKEVLGLVYEWEVQETTQAFNKKYIRTKAADISGNRSGVVQSHMNECLTSLSLFQKSKSSHLLMLMLIRRTVGRFTSPRWGTLLTS